MQINLTSSKTIAPRTTLLRYAFLFIVVLAVCLISPISPISNVAPGMDSSVFLTIAQGMHSGKIPYLDYFDHKGPLLYLINYIGLFAGGRCGVWLIELFSMTIAIFFAYKTTKLLADRHAAFWGSACAFVVAMSFFAQGNVPEEYAMPLLFISLFIYARHLLKHTPLTSLQIFITGGCYGASLMLKPNFFAIWFVFSATIVLRDAFTGEWRNAFRYVAFFFAGVFAAMLPFIIWLVANGALGAFIDQYILFNRTYASHNNSWKLYLFNAFTTINKVYTWLLLLAALFWIIQRFNTKTRLFYIAYAGASFLAVLVVALSHFNFYQYSMVLVPLLAPALAFFINVFLDGLDSENFAIMKNRFISRGILPALVLLCAFNYQVSYCIGVVFVRMFPDGVSRNYVPLTDVKKACEIISANTTAGDKITVWGNACYIYYYSGKQAESKYIYQWPPALRSTEIRDEYETSIITKQPKLILIPIAHAEAAYTFRAKFPAIHKLIADNYEKIYEQHGFIQVFKRKTN
jgi:hypothetical protein